MSSNNKLYHFSKDGKNFTSLAAARSRLIYLPLSGVTSEGLKSSITPSLSGDIKIDKNSFLSKPASRENLRSNLRNFFIYNEKN